ncbi:hypothetical protein TI39_contig278g00003 [Zymoseptoria brevis]|uniref:Uncharacterized protein n=1 Tax=Zymoseptoria brevis TaxID=1047168 RepID=A0A0F4GXP2_9PEZI|nr:hypothetical protein TI39_contig278g00003 [Zymoseptoria brevis]
MTSPINSNLIHSATASAVAEHQLKRKAKTTHVASPGDDPNAAFAMIKSISSKGLSRIAANVRINSSRSMFTQGSRTQDEQSVDDQAHAAGGSRQAGKSMAQDEVNDKHKRYGPASSEFIGVVAEIVKANPGRYGKGRVVKWAGEG